MRPFCLMDGTHDGLLISWQSRMKQAYRHDHLTAQAKAEAFGWCLVLLFHEREKSTRRKGTTYLLVGSLSQYLNLGMTASCMAPKISK